MSDFYYDLEQVKSTLKCALKNMYEVCLSSTDLSGYSVNKNYKLGVNITTGKLFYVDEEGDWQPVPTVEGGDFTLEIEDTDTVDLSGEGTEVNPLKADVKIDPDENNLLSSTENGLLVTYEEIDPTVGDHIKNITIDNIADWGEAYNWGDHSIVGYLLSETDPTVAAHIKAITNTDITNWNTAFGWGNHASAGYLTSLIAAGSTTEIQFNNAGAFAASNLLAWSIADSRLLLGNPSLLQVNAAETFVTTGNIRTLGGGINFTLNSNSFNGFKSVGAGHGINIWTVGSKIAAFGGNGSSSTSENGYLKLTGNYNHSAITSVMRGLIISGSVIPAGISSAAVNFIELSPTIQQTGSDPINHLGTGPIRGFYYNPTINSLNGSPHIAFENTSGSIVHGNLAGIGSRMVVADSTGKLSTQAIPNNTLPANSFIVNNTNAPATPTYPDYYEVLNQPLSSAGFVWTGTAAPTGTEDHYYSWWKRGKEVKWIVTVYYTSSGIGVTGLSIPLPNTMPLPYVRPSFDIAGANLYTGSGKLIVNIDTSIVATNIGSSVLRVNSTNTGYELFIGGTSGSQRVILAEITYQSI